MYPPLVRCGWTEHVGELELWVEVGDEPGVFAEAPRALGDVLADGEREPRDVIAEGMTVPFSSPPGWRS